eukprot:2572986-Prymnesium_polylepis.1
MPDTLVGRLAACSLTMVGVLAAAMITAMFADSFELDQSELWLITQIEKQHQDKELKDAASQLVSMRSRFDPLVLHAQHSWLSLRPRPSIQMQNAFRARRIRNLQAIKNSKVLSKGNDFVQGMKLDRAVRQMKKRRLNIHGARTMDSVINIRVLHGEVAKLNYTMHKKMAAVEHRQFAMEAKLDAKLDAVLEAIRTGADGPSGCGNTHEETLDTTSSVKSV